jgi:hypothetical protein
MADRTDDAADLLQGAFADGELSQESAQALLGVGNVGHEIGPALGADASKGELLLVTILADDSGSIDAIPGGASAVSQGHNRCLEALETEDDTEVLVHTRYLNAGTLSPYSPLATAARLSSENFRPNAGATPLYRQSVLTLGAVMAKAREQKDKGRRVRAFTLLITDGGDNASGNVTAESVRFLVRDMLEFSDDYIVAGMGIGQTEYFRQIFRAMGIPEGWILTADATPEEIQGIFQKIARSLRLAAGGGDSGWLQLEAGPVSDD